MQINDKVTQKRNVLQVTRSRFSAVLALHHALSYGSDCPRKDILDDCPFLDTYPS